MRLPPRFLFPLMAVAWTVLCIAAGPPTGDFANYYTAAALWWTGTPLDQVYDYGWFTEQAWRMGFEDQAVGFAVLTPPSALLMLPLVGLGAQGAAIAWWVGQWALGLLLGAQLGRLAHRPEWMGIAVLLLTAPVWHAHLTQGQVHLPVVCLVAAALLGWESDQDELAGIALGVAIGLKIHAWPLLVVAAFAHRYRLLVTAAGTLGVGAIGSITLLGWPVHEVFFTEIAPSAAAGWFVHPWHPALGAAGHLLRHLFVPHPVLNEAWMDAPGLATRLTTGLTCVVVGLTLARAAAWSHLDPDQRRDLLAAAAIAALVSGALLAHYHLALVAPAIALACRRVTWRTLGVVVLAVLACVVPQPTAWPDGPAVLFAIPRFWLLLTVWALLVPWRIPWSVGPTAAIAVIGGLLTVLARPPIPPQGAAIEGPLILSGLRIEDDQLHVAGLSEEGWSDFVLEGDRLVRAGTPVLDGSTTLEHEGDTYVLTDQGVGVRALQLRRLP